MRSTYQKAFLLVLLAFGLTTNQAQAGSIVRLFFDGITGSIVDFTNNVAFPNGADDQELRTDFLEGSIGNPGVENFGSLIKGWIIAPTSGNYIFWLCSDDQSNLYLSTDANASNKKWIAMEPTWNDSRTYDTTTRRNATTPENRSTTFTNNATMPAGFGGVPYTITLVSNTQYYIEVVHKEGTGGDNVSVGWTLPGGVQQRPIPGVYMQAFNPPGTGLAITTQPADTTTVEAGSATLFVTIQAVPPVSYKWYRNGTVIPGATLPFYTVNPATLADNNAKFKVDVIAETTIQSEEHTLTVNADTTAPSITAVSTRGNPNAVQVQYSEAVLDSTATAVGNYSISGSVTISSVVKATNAANAVVYQLNTSAMVEGRSYTLTVNNVKDLAQAGNTISSGSQFQFFLLTGTVTRRLYDVAVGGSITTFTNSAAFRNNQPISQDALPAIGWPTVWDINTTADRNTPSDFSYGSELIGYLIPPASGLYTFWIATDDVGRLFLSTDSSPSNKQLIAQELTWNARRNYTGAHGGTSTVADTATGRLVNQSLPIQLTGGTKYFMQSLQAEGGGGDNHSVGWQGPDGIPPANNFSGDVQSYAISSYSTLGPVSITNLVGGDQTVNELGSLTYRVYADGTTPYTYQWQRAPVATPTAFVNISFTGYDLRNTAVALADAGVYRVIVNNWFSSATSGTVNVTVIQDLTKPRLANPAPIADPSYKRIVVNFTENVTQLSQTNILNYTLDKGLTVTNAARLSGTQTLLTVSPNLVPNERYTLTIKNIQDLAATPNTIDTTNVTVSGWVVAKGAATSYIWDGANSMANVRARIAANTTPNFIFTMTTWNSRTYYPGDGKENYGSSNAALIYPPLSGDYRFFLTGDDRAELYLSSDTDPANATLIASAVWQDGGAFRTAPAAGQATQPASVPVTLNAGQAYYLYSLFFEGTGGDYSMVGWRIPGEDLGDVTGLTALPGTFLGTILPPDNASVTFTQQPVSLTVAASSAAAFTARAAVTSAYTTTANYQWQRANAGSTTFTDIAGASGATYTIKYPGAADNGAQFRSIGTVANVSATSSVAVLTVTVDITPPKLIAAISIDGASVTLIFNEPVSGTGATYTLTGGATVNSVAPRAAAPQIIDLQTSALTLGNTYTLTASNVGDLAGNKSSFTTFVTAQTYAANPATLVTLTTIGRKDRGSIAENLRGFNFNTAFIAEDQGTTFMSNTLAQAEMQFLGQNGVNSLTGAAAKFNFPGVINFDHNNPLTVQGRVSGETQFPDQLAANRNFALNNHSIEVLCYVDLTAGIHRWGVNSDDGFRVSNSPTLSATDPDQVIMGFFEGGRGAADTRFDFVVPQDGLYPIRLIWEQGIGGANLEWWEKSISQDDAATGPWLLINGTDGGPKAYQGTNSAGGGVVLPVPGPITLSRVGSSVTLTWNAASTATLQSATDLSASTVWSNVTGAGAGTYTTTSTSDRVFYRLKR